jgi:FtsH-binding integral membrane protein
MDFIKKVYATFTIMLLVTAIFVVICLQNHAIAKFQWKYWPLLILAFIAIITIEILLFCCPSVSRKYPTNINLLIIFTICYAYIIGFICSFFNET